MGDALVRAHRQDGEQVVRRVEHQPVGLGAVFHRHLLDGLVLVQRGQDVEALEHPVHQKAGLVGGGVVLRVAVCVQVVDADLVAGVGAVQHHREVALAVLVVPGHQVGPVLEGAGLAAHAVAAVKLGARALADHHVGVEQVVGARGVAGQHLAHVVLLGGNDLFEGVEAEGVAEHQVKVPGGGDVFDAHAHRVHEVGAGAADLFGLGVHHVDEVLLAAAAHIVGDDHGRVGAAVHQHGVQQVAQGVGLAGADVRHLHALAVKFVLHIAGHGHGDGIQLVLILLQQQNGGHHLGGAGGGQRLVAVLFVNDDVGVQIDHIGPGGGHLKGRGEARGRGGQGQQPGQRRKGQQKGDGFFHIDFSL